MKNTGSGRVPFGIACTACWASLGAGHEEVIKLRNISSRQPPWSLDHESFPKVSSDIFFPKDVLRYEAEVQFARRDSSSSGQ